MCTYLCRTLCLALRADKPNGKRRFVLALLLFLFNNPSDWRNSLKFHHINKLLNEIKHTNTYIYISILGVYTERNEIPNSLYDNLFKHQFLTMLVNLYNVCVCVCVSISYRHKTDNP